LSGTSLANLEPDREIDDVSKKKPTSIKTIKGISNLFYWKWPISGEMTDYIRA